jgi:hypothetical protein
MTSEKKLRIDMVIRKVEEIDEEKHLFRFLAVPDPRVWKRAEINGEKGYLHKIDNVFLLDKELAKAAPTLSGKAIYVHTVGIDAKTKNDYITKSKRRVRKRH